MAPIISLRGVSKHFGNDPQTRVIGLDDVSLDIWEGEFVAIVGPSGGGKTTLMSILGLLDVPSHGEYFLGGVTTSGLTDRERTRLRAFHLGFVFQSFHLLDRRPVVDSVELGLLYQGAPSRERAQVVQNTLTRFGLGERSSAKAGTLSGGQRQRVAIARALAAGNPILLADEPTGNLDSENGAAVLEELVRINDEGHTVVVVTHSEEVALTAHRRIRLADGKIVADSGHDDSRSPRSPHERDETRRPTMRALISDALRSTASRGVQTTSLVVAVAIAVALVVVSIGLGQSARAQVADTFDRFANRDVSAAWTTSTTDMPEPARAVESTEKLAGVEAVAVFIDRGQSSVSNADVEVVVTRQGVLGNIAAVSDAEITTVGSYSGEIEEGTVLIGRTLAQQLSIAPLESSPILVVDGSALRVVGIIESSRRYPALLGQVVTTTTFGSNSTGEAQVTVAIRALNGAAQQVGSQLPAALSPTNASAIRVSTPVEANTLRNSIESGLQAALAAFALLSCLTALFMLTNAISSSVIARTGEFGLRRAVGARSSDVAKLVSLESVILGALGGLAGLTVGLVAILAFTIAQGWMPVFDLVLAPLAVAIGILIAALSSVMGAVRASRMRPADALRT